MFFGTGWSQKNGISESKKRPRIGLVLSGGGAKGFAHIGVIQLLEEVGIVPDYVTGTSIGSIVGGLYSMGYSVEEMHSLADTTNWDMVLSNTVPLSEVTISEKPYYGSFLTEMDITKKGVSLPGGLIEGQNLLEYLSVLSRPVHGVNSFLDFPIPFTCVATDIVNAKPVALNQGNIIDAIRASMAIPTAFTPVEYDTLLLIDGGWTRNLPVQEAKDMGADIIISVNVGAPLLKKEELQSMISILDQTAWMMSVKDTEVQLANSDYVVTPPVSTFSTFAFDEADTIIKLGYEEALKQKEVFQALSDKIYGKTKPEKAQKIFDEEKYVISDVQVNGTKLTSEKFITGRLGIKMNEPISAQEVARKIGLLYGSLYYKKVSFELVPQTDSTQQLQVNVVEDNPAKLKLSLYYDSENSIGINANVTVRNLALENSRLIFDGFLSENPILGVKYLKYMGLDQQAFLYADFRYTKDSNYQWENLYGQPAGFNYNELIGQLGFAYTFDNNFLLGASYGVLGAKANPTTNPDTIIDQWRQKQNPLHFVATYNSFDKAVFPTRGFKGHAYASYHFNINHTAKLRPDYVGIPQELVDEIVHVDPYYMFRVSMQHFIPVSKNVSMYWDARLDMGSQDEIGFNEHSKIGGIAPILNSGVPFWGLTRNELNISQLSILSAGCQWNISGGLFLKGKVNYLNSQYPMELIYGENRQNTFELYGKMRTELWGGGLELAYSSPLGPIRAVVHKNTESDAVHLFVGIGYNIYKSDGDY